MLTKYPHPLLFFLCFFVFPRETVWDPVEYDTQSRAVLPRFLLRPGTSEKPAIGSIFIYILLLEFDSH